MRPILTFQILLGLAGCAAEMELSTAPFDNESAGTEVGTVQSYRIDVSPGASLGRDGSVLAMPTSVGPFEVERGLAENVGPLSLAVPILLEGLVTGETTTPWADAQLPSVPGPVDAEVRIVRPDSVQQYLSRTDLDGLFSTLVAGTDSYNIAVVPADPQVPFTTLDVVVSDTDFSTDFELDYGVPVYGRILDTQGLPVPGLSVFAQDETGLQGSAVTTDAGGWYVLRVNPGPYTVIAEDRLDGFLPRIRQDAEPLDSTGYRLDFLYPSAQSSRATGRVENPTGEPLNETLVRFTSKGLAGYEGLDHSLVVETLTGSFGNFDVALLDGNWQVEFLPRDGTAPGERYGPALIANTDDVGGFDLGTITLPEFTQVTGQTRDSNGIPVVGALVDCEEVAFGQRTWSTVSDEFGEYTIQLPPTQIRCTTIPPSNRLDLAWTPEVFDSAAAPVLNLQMIEGTLLEGRVMLEGNPEPFALVDIRDESGRLVTSTITDSSGAFEARVP